MIPFCDSTIKLLRFNILVPNFCANGIFACDAPFGTIACGILLRTPGYYPEFRCHNMQVLNGASQKCLFIALPPVPNILNQMLCA